MQLDGMRARALEQAQQRTAASGQSDPAAATEALFAELQKSQQLATAVQPAEVPVDVQNLPAPAAANTADVIFSNSF